MAYQPKSYKKFVATAATATLVATAVVPGASAAVKFEDVSSSYKTAVDYLISKNITEGISDTKFGTDAPIKRGDAAIFIAKALGLDTKNAPDQDFTDVNSRVEGAVNAIVNAKIASGKTESKFAPDDYITRQEMAKILVNAYALEAGDTKNSFTDVNSNWDAYVDALVENGVTLGKTEKTFASTDTVKRGEFALFIHRAENLAPKTPSVVSVSATNSTTLTLSGVALDKLTAADVKVTDNTVASYVPATDGKTAKLTLGTSLVDGEEATVTVGDATFKVTFKLSVTTVSVKPGVYDDDTSKQTVKLIVDGQEVTGADLLAAGYSVAFEAYEDKNGVTAFGGGTATDLFQDASAGILKDDIATVYGSALPTAGVIAHVGVTITKGSTVYASGLHKITLKNTDLATEVINAVEFTDTTTGYVKQSSTLTVGETASVTELELTVDKNEEYVTSGYSVTSSNPAVATVDPATNVITALTPGTTNLVVTYGNVSKTIAYKVENGVRELSKVSVVNSNSLASTQISSFTLANDGTTTGANNTVYVKGFDQFGDLVDLDASSVAATAVASDSAVVTPGAIVDLAPTGGNGVFELPLVAGTKGSAYLTFEGVGGFKINSNVFKVNVTENATAATYKLELAAGAESYDNTLNLADADDNTATFKLVPYTAEGVKLAAVTLTSSDYAIAQGSAVVTDAVSSGAIVLTAGKTGTATVTVTYAGKKYTQTVTVIDAPTKIGAVTFKSVAKPTYAKTYDYKDLFTFTASGNDPVLKGITVTPASSQPVRYGSTSGTEDIYLDKNANGIFDGSDVPLGNFFVNFVDVDGTVTADAASYALPAGSEGTLLFKVVDTKGAVIKTSSVSVDL